MQSFKVILILTLNIYLGDGSTGADGADGVGGVRDFVATGTLPNGTPVILKADGTVEAVGTSLVTASNTVPLGGTALFSPTNRIQDNHVAFDGTNVGKFVIVYKDDLVML